MGGEWSKRKSRRIRISGGRSIHRRRRKRLCRSERRSIIVSRVLKMSGSGRGEGNGAIGGAGEREQEGLGGKA